MYFPVYLLDELVFCQWGVVFVGRTTVAFCDVQTTISRLFIQDWKKGNMLSLLSFSVPDMQIKTAGSGGVAKEQIKHRQKNANKTEMPEKIRVLSKSTELRLEMKCLYWRNKNSRYEMEVYVFVTSPENSKVNS